MKTTAQLKSLIEVAGGTLEEDAPLRTDTRVFQAVAPTGKLWRNTELHCLVVLWAKGKSKQAQSFNNESFADIKQRISGGCREMTLEELDEYADD